ncbi:MAG: DUF262 domain-containing HNH endonuclease family protein [Neomegalonema sp.]|nr:DUF262 domain-containing HNH endonuclease family protein [Neomegalonema sp.]
MNKFLNAAAKAVGAVLSPDRRLIIPGYQRPYAWTADEAMSLLTDIRAAKADASEADDDAPPYFLGAIVLSLEIGEDAAQIVDGHQRLTTLAILLAVLRDLDEEGPTRLGRLLTVRGRNADDIGGAVVSPRPLDLDFYHREILREGATAALTEETTVENDAQANMLAVALAFRGALREGSARSRMWLAEYVLRCCVMVEVSAPYQEHAYKIFTVLNARGKDLKDNDLLKAELLGHIRPDRQPRFTGVWERLESSLGEATFAQLFSCIRMIHSPGKARKSTVAEIRERLNPAADPEKFILEELEPKGDAYQTLLKADLKIGAQSARANQLLRALGRIRNRDWLAPAVSFLVDRAPRGDELLRFLSALERLAYGLLLQNADENVRISRYSKVVAAIRDDQPIEEILELMELSDYDRRVARMVLAGSFNQKELRIPILLRLDEHLSGAIASYEVPIITVEHVLPRRPAADSEWLINFPDEKERKFWTERLGNLALLSRRINNQAANMSFEKKKNEYFSANGVTPFAVTTAIIAEPEWTPEVVERRQRHLFRTACKIWRLLD